ncbi:MAG: hypothetical protein OXT09_21465, partial [Myxococcales bacterium]|nr:hypothetical protein [Myxococcales bacterium]
DSGHRGTRLAAAVGMLREWAKLCRNRCVGLALAVLLLACSSTKRDRPAQQTAESSDAAASSDAGSSSTATDVPTPIEGPSASGGAAPSPAEVCRPRDPDVESDACLGCLVRECCDGAGGPCLSVVRYHFDDEGLPIDEPVVSRRCYEGHFGCVRACFAQLQSSATQEEAWNAARRCADECSGDVDDDGPFPTGGSPATHLLRCVVGDGPAAEDTDGTDARCVAECLPEWPD